MTFLIVWRTRDSPWSKGGYICNCDPRICRSHWAAWVSEGLVLPCGVHCAWSGNHLHDKTVLWRILTGQGKWSVFAITLFMSWNLSFQAKSVVIVHFCFNEVLSLGCSYVFMKIPNRFCHHCCKLQFHVSL
jgi:hypothetical protein